MDNIGKILYDCKRKNTDISHDLCFAVFLVDYFCSTLRGEREQVYAFLVSYGGIKSFSLFNQSTSIIAHFGSGTPS